MSEAGKAGSLLIVASQRDDRRALFDALDGHEFEAIYTAKDVEQARTLLAQDPAVDLVLIDFVGEAREAVAFCTQLHGDPRYAKLPLLGILAAESQGRVWGFHRPPPGVVDWLRSPVDAAEALVRVRAALQRRGAASPAAANGGDGYRFAFDGSRDELVVSDPQSGAILEVNATFERRSGFSAARAVGRPLDWIDASHGREQRLEFQRRVEQEGRAVYRCEKPRADGTTYPVEVTTQLAVRDGRLVYFSVVRSLGELHRMQAAMALLTRMLATGSGDEGVQRAAQLLAEALALDFVIVLSARPEESGTPTPLALVQRIGLPPDAPDLLRQPTLKLVLDGETVAHAEDAQRLAEADAFVRTLGLNGLVGMPLADERNNVLGALLVGARAPIAGGDGMLQTLRVAAARFAFELELRRAREQGRAKGLQDALTGLPNRLLFNDRLETTIREAHRTGEMFAVLFVDLDRFKNINDSLGHSVGDEVLVAVAKRLRASVRASDTVARYAGDEFTLILRHITQREDVLRIAEKIVRIMEAPLTLADGAELHITSSIGVAFYPDDGNTAERLLKHADVAMYSAKGMGRNNYQAYVAVPEESHQQRIALEAKLRQAEKNGELRVYYQPQVSAQTEDIVGMEALIRWEHPELGMISPGFFIPLAEETGLIVSMGEWVLRTACRDARRWQQRFGLPLRIGVNLSPLQLMQPNLAELVRSVLEETGLEPSTLDLEVTESINVKSIPNLLETLQTLHDFGCHISIDDFGTGQSSLDYIKRFPADRIKIDQTFVRNIGVDPDDEAIVKATLSMAHNLSRAVIAEGVEIEQHLEFLRAHGCEELQGYLFSRPLAPTAFENMLAERERLLAAASGAAGMP
ncbi:PAS/PAC sensor-containing diguanylate cyclase/phosphodiesterase [Mizugakiibacter sediminis]|uniref:cyclic-guanylate-specific phosphodiesterase n=1 Tax=Mizugakiibacter sediminis TaxID=1475481 RepID=A0A0K8QKN5_9GAMM|nr:EAL domain-containing protein [Mizugakiibacter sediminis]GAP65047.1 PAS/PAC sensor-containing diguanylate cyclase/phosphodiesterase [Mizugakiibacter sediminis]